MYTYNATIVEVYDGDTVRADIDLGFSIFTRRFDLRLYGINAPELRTPTMVAGTIARDALRALILGKPVVITTFKDKQEKYGRYLAKITTADGIEVNDWMISQGFAVPYMVN